MKKWTIVILVASALLVGLMAVPAQGTVPAPPVGTRTLGFYVNHPCVIQQVLPVDGIESVDDVIAIIKDRDTHASRLASQLMVTRLNVAVFGIGDRTLDELGLGSMETVNEVIAQAEALRRQAAEIQATQARKRAEKSEKELKQLRKYRAKLLRKQSKRKKRRSTGKRKRK